MQIKEKCPRFNYDELHLPTNFHVHTNKQPLNPKHSINLQITHNLEYWKHPKIFPSNPHIAVLHPREKKKYWIKKWNDLKIYPFSKVLAQNSRNPKIEIWRMMHTYHKNNRNIPFNLLCQTTRFPWEIRLHTSLTSFEAWESWKGWNLKDLCLQSIPFFSTPNRCLSSPCCSQRELYMYRVYSLLQWCYYYQDNSRFLQNYRKFCTLSWSK